MTPQLLVVFFAGKWDVNILLILLLLIDFDGRYVIDGRRHRSVRWMQREICANICTLLSVLATSANVEFHVCGAKISCHIRGHLCFNLGEHIVLDKTTKLRWANYRRKKIETKYSQPNYRYCYDTIMAMVQWWNLWNFNQLNTVNERLSINSPLQIKFYFYKITSTEVWFYHWYRSNLHGCLSLSVSGVSIYIDTCDNIDCIERHRVNRMQPIDL